MFERHGIKTFVVATPSTPSPFGELRDHLEAETVQTLQLPGELLVSAQPLVFLDGYRFSLLDGDPVQVLAVCEEFPVHSLAVRGEFPVQGLELVESWFFSTKEELVCQLVRRGVLSVEGVSRGVLSVEGDFVRGLNKVSFYRENSSAYFSYRENSSAYSFFRKNSLVYYFYREDSSVY